MFSKGGKMHSNKHTKVENETKNPKTTHPITPTCWCVFVHIIIHVNSRMRTHYGKFKSILKSRPFDIRVLIFLGQSWGSHGSYFGTLAMNVLISKLLFSL